MLQKFCVGVREFNPAATITIGETNIDYIAGADYFWDGTGDLGRTELGVYHGFYPARNEGVEKSLVRAENETKARGGYYKSNASTNQIEISAAYLPNYPTSAVGASPLWNEILEIDGTKSLNVFEISGGPVISEKGFFKYSSYTIVNKDIGESETITGDVLVFDVVGRTITVTQEIRRPSGSLSDVTKFDVTRGDVANGGWTQWQFVKQLPSAMVNLSWPQAILDNSGEPTSMDWEIQFRNVSGSISTYSGTKETYDNSPVYHSQYHAALGSEVESFRVRRTTPTADTESDLTIDSCFSLKVYSPTEIDGHGILSTTYRGGRYDTQPQTGNVSIISSPKYYNYNGTDSITLKSVSAPSRVFADSVLTDLVLAYGTTDVDEIKEIADIDTLYDIADSLSLNLKAFSFTFDDEDIDLEKRLTTACNAARVSTYREGGAYWRFTRDESKPVTAIFNRRNIAGSSENEFTYEGWKPLDKNGVSVRYVDWDNDYREAYVYRSISGGSITTAQPSRPLEIDLAGCDNTTQAENRADLEVRKLIYQRRKAKERVLSDGLNVAIGDRVRWAPIYDDALSHGEVMEVTDADTVTVSEPVSGTLYVHYTDGDGAVVGPVVCTGSGYTLTRTSGPTFADAVIADDDNQAGSMYVAGTTTALNYTDMTVTSVTPRADDTVDIEMIEYNELVFSED